MQGMQLDGGDTRLLEPVTERIIGYAFRPMPSAIGSLKKSTRTPLSTRAGAGSSSSGKIVVFTTT
jgi:hypothetical protein